MADYIAQPDTAVDPDAPVTSDLMYALRDNPVAIAEGAAGAPRIADAALSLVVTTAGRNWVAARYASSAWNGVGSIVMARGPARQVTAGTVEDGSSLAPANSSGSASASSLTGMWECLGYIPPTPSGAERVTIWRRVS